MGDINLSVQCNVEYDLEVDVYHYWLIRRHVEVGGGWSWWERFAEFTKCVDAEMMLGLLRRKEGVERSGFGSGSS